MSSAKGTGRGDEEKGEGEERERTYRLLHPPTNIKSIPMQEITFQQLVGNYSIFNLLKKAISTAGRAGRGRNKENKQK